MSDTIAVAASYDPGRRADSDFLQHAAGPLLQRAVMEVTQRVYQSASVGSPPLALRGAVAMGELIVQESFLVGPAVDRAAELMNLPEAACVFLDPAAPSWSSDHCFSFELPLKTIGRLSVPVMNPLGGCSQATAERIKRGLLKAFGKNPSDLSVLAKRSNTEALLKQAMAHTPHTASARTPEQAFEALLRAEEYAKGLSRSSQD
jgi:hypothetical protein